MDMRGRLEMLSDMRRKHLPQLRLNCADSSKDKTGSASNSLAGTLRFLAVSDYVLHKNIAAFRSGLVEAASLRSRLFERFDAGEEISPSYVSMMSYKALLNALAAGDEPLAQAFASQIGGRESVELEHDRPFDRAFGYALKSILASDLTAARRWINALDAACQVSESVDFKGYAMVLRAILNQDSRAAHEGIVNLLAGHKRQSKGTGLFKDSEDEVLCVWGIGAGNLLRMKGVAIQIDDALIPAELLVDVQRSS